MPGRARAKPVMRKMAQQRAVKSDHEQGDLIVIEPDSPQPEVTNMEAMKDDGEKDLGNGTPYSTAAVHSDTPRSPGSPSHHDSTVEDISGGGFAPPIHDPTGAYALATEKYKKSLRGSDSHNGETAVGFIQASGNANGHREGAVSLDNDFQSIDGLPRSSQHLRVPHHFHGRDSSVLGGIGGGLKRRHSDYSEDGRDDDMNYSHSHNALRSASYGPVRQHRQAPSFGHPQDQYYPHGHPDNEKSGLFVSDSSIPTPLPEPRVYNRQVVCGGVPLQSNPFSSGSSYKPAYEMHGAHYPQTPAHHIPGGNEDYDDDDDDDDDDQASMDGDYEQIDNESPPERSHKSYHGEFHSDEFASAYGDRHPPQPVIAERLIGKNLKPSRFSGTKDLPWGVNKFPTVVSHDAVTDASLMKRKLKRGAGDKTCSRAYGANDPENILIVNLRDMQKLSFRKIADHLNTERIKNGKDGNLNDSSVNSRYNRTAPIIYAARGQEFVPLSKRAKDWVNGEPMRSEPKIEWRSEVDVELVRFYDDYERARWSTIAKAMRDKFGMPFQEVNVAKRYKTI